MCVSNRERNTRKNLHVEYVRVDRVTGFVHASLLEFVVTVLGSKLNSAHEFSTHVMFVVGA